jgi:hypothetical protein
MEKQFDFGLSKLKSFSIKDYFRKHKTQKYIAMAGAVTAGLQAVGLGFFPLPLVTLAGMLVGGLALMHIMNPECDNSKAVKAAVVGIGATFLLSYLPFSPILTYLPSMLTASGLGVLAVNVYEYFKSKQ